MYSAQYFRIEGADTHEVSGYRDYIADGPMLRRQARSSLAHLERFVAEPHGRLLEIGCAAGFFLDEARARGWSPTGVEVSRFAATFARDELGLDVVCGNVADGNFADREFEAGAILNTLEHLRDPLAALRELWRVLRPGSPLLVAVPNLESLSSRLMGSRWFEFKPREHLYYFTPETLAVMLAAAGFRVASTRSTTVSISLGYLAERAGYYLRRPPGSLIARAAGLAAGASGLGRLVIPLPIGQMTAVAIRED